jgi:hypothetical protein
VERNLVHWRHCLIMGANPARRLDYTESSRRWTEPWQSRTLDEELLARAVEDWVPPSELLGVV